MRSHRLNRSNHQLGARGWTSVSMASFAMPLRRLSPRCWEPGEVVDGGGRLVGLNGQVSGGLLLSRLGSWWTGWLGSSCAAGTGQPNPKRCHAW